MRVEQNATVWPSREKCASRSADDDSMSGDDSPPGCESMDRHVQPALRECEPVIDARYIRHAPTPATSSRSGWSVAIRVHAPDIAIERSGERSVHQRPSVRRPDDAIGAKCLDDTPRGSGWGEVGLQVDHVDFTVVAKSTRLIGQLSDRSAKPPRNQRVVGKRVEADAEWLTALNRQWRTGQHPSPREGFGSRPTTTNWESADHDMAELPTGKSVIFVIPVPNGAHDVPAWGAALAHRNERTRHSGRVATSLEARRQSHRRCRSGLNRRGSFAPIIVT